jgi:NSS family neurotransmitter:Na+ symporter
LATNILQPTGGILLALFAGWVMQKKITEEELQLPKHWFSIWRILIRYVAPTGILIIFITSLF